MVRESFDDKRKNGYIIIASYILTILIAIFIYLTGGAPSAFANLMYIPIATVSSIAGKTHGVIHGSVCGILLSPYMPLDTELGLNQPTIDWVIRMAIYIIIGFIIGFFSDYNKKNSEYISNLLTRDTITNLKNFEAIKRKDFNKDIPKTIIALSVKEYEETLRFFGYDFTNNAISQFSKRLVSILKKYDNTEVFRYDGMEFVIVISNTKASKAKSDVDEIINTLNTINKSTIKVDDIPIYIEIIMGITNIAGNVSILEGARQALVSLRFAIDKDSKLEIYNDDLEEYFKSVISIASEFRLALRKKDIKVAYQNIYYTDTGNLYGSELLTRWTKGQDIYYRPDEFIPIIEKTELIDELSKSIIDNAINIILRANNNPIVVSINLSPSNFKDEIIDYLLTNIEEKNINPSQLQVEITEDILVKKEEIIEYLNRLRDYGLSIAIDDFGSGYSSYQYITELPIDVIKIDKSIVMKIDKNLKSRSLVKSIVNFCKDSRIKTVAEGVESIEILDICKELDIDYIQGYYCHKPTIIN